MNNRKPASRPVYSTDRGRLCPNCGAAIKACSCRNNRPAPAGDGIVRVGRQTRGRKGRGVTTITGLPLDGDELKRYAATLKKLCGTGGAVKEGVVEIQGDQRDRLIPVLRERGWTVVRSGG